MVSQHFWPQLQGEDLKLHPIMEERLGEFSKAYSVIKNPRLLVWKKQVRIGREMILTRSRHSDLLKRAAGG